MYLKIFRSDHPSALEKDVNNWLEIAPLKIESTGFTMAKDEDTYAIAIWYSGRQRSGPGVA